MVAGLHVGAGQGGMHAMTGRQGPLGRMGAIVLRCPSPPTSGPAAKGKQRVCAALARQSGSTGAHYHVATGRAGDETARLPGVANLASRARAASHANDPVDRCSDVRRTCWLT